MIYAPTDNRILFTRRIMEWVPIGDEFWGIDVYRQIKDVLYLFRDNKYTRLSAIIIEKELTRLRVVDRSTG